jgi:hypothetical protein
MKNQKPQKGIPTVDQWGSLSEAFLECGKDGIIRVKDGRTLDEYINDPRLVKRRKNCKAPKPTGMQLVSNEFYNRLLIPHCA